MLKLKHLDRALRYEARMDELKARQEFGTVPPAPTLAQGQPCDHPGCLSHISHPCEGCGRIGGGLVRHNAEFSGTPAASSPEAPLERRVMHCFSELQGASKYPIRQETNHDKSALVIRLAGGTQGDVVGMNDTMRLYACFSKDGNVMYVDYDA